MVIVKKRLSFLILLAACLAAADKPKTLKPGFNFFSKDQDIQLGREAAAQVERQMQVINTPGLADYVQRVGAKLTAQPEADKYPYSFKVVNEKSINAFALPGGPTFVHTGLIASAENEAQLAGVLAHEISHVALRHGTHQVSKANFIQMGAALIGAVGPNGILGQLAQIGVGLGANSLLLKYSRDAEHDADILGARIMSKAGYNPIEMAHFFEKLEAQDKRGGGGTAQFFSDHPNPGNRVTYVTEEVRMMPSRQYAAEGPDLKRAQEIVAGLPAPPPRGKAAAAGQPGGTVDEARPSAGFREYRGQLFTISYPENWQAYDGRNNGVTIAARAGLLQRSDAGTEVSYGLLADVMQTRQPADVERDTQTLLETFQQSSSGLQRGRDAERRLDVDGRPARLNLMYSKSAWQGQREVDAVVTVASREGLLYFVFIAPESDYPRAQPVFDQMIRSIRLPR